MRFCDVGFRPKGEEGDGALGTPCHVCELVQRRLW